MSNANYLTGEIRFDITPDIQTVASQISLDVRDFGFAAGPLDATVAAIPEIRAHKLLTNGKMFFITTETPNASLGSDGDYAATLGEDGPLFQKVSGQWAQGDAQPQSIPLAAVSVSGFKLTFSPGDGVTRFAVANPHAFSLTVLLKFSGAVQTK